jgi:flagellar protein FlbD
MIALTRLNGMAVMVNIDQITWIEHHPDTVVALANGDKLFVRETPEQIRDRVIEFRRALLTRIEPDVRALRLVEEGGASS